MKELSRALSLIPVSAPTAVDTLVKERRAAGETIISFCVGEPDFATPWYISEAGMEAIRGGKTKYTQPSGTPALRRAAAESLQKDYGLSYDWQQVVITTGAKYAVYAAVMAICDSGDEVIVPAPLWPSYRPILRLAGVTAVTVDCRAEDDWKLTAKALCAAASVRTKALILNNPNNPSGMVYYREDLLPLAEACREADLYVIADEVYGRLIYDGRTFTPAAAVSADMKERTVTIGGVSKGYAMTGWRIGFAAAPEEIARRMSVFVNHTTGGPCTISQEAALCALTGPDDESRRMCAAYEQRRNAVCDALAAVPYTQFRRPQGAFYILLDAREAIERMDGVKNDLDFAMQLLNEENVAVVPCADYGVPGFLRLSYTLEISEALTGAERMAAFVRRRCGK